MSEALRVVVVDDHPLFLDGLVSALSDRGIVVVGTASAGEQAIAAVQSQRPDVVLMDLSMPGMGGVEATRQIVAAHPDVAVLVLTMSEDDDSVFAALRAGARGYLLKEADGEDILRAVKGVARGDAVIGGRIANRMLAAFSSPTGPAPHAFPHLTRREREVLDLIARGYGNQRIATRLGLTEKTVRNHVSSVFAKLRVASRAEAVAVARDAGLGQGP